MNEMLRYYIFVVLVDLVVKFFLHFFSAIGSMSPAAITGLQIHVNGMQVDLQYPFSQEV